MRNLLYLEIVDTFSSANISIEKLDVLKLENFLLKPLQVRYLVLINYEAFKAKMREVKQIFKAADSSEIASDEGTDDKYYYVLHIFKVPQFYRFRNTSFLDLLSSVHLETVQSTDFFQNIVQCFTNIKMISTKHQFKVTVE